MVGKGDKNLPYDLENMSIPELEALLQQDFLASESSAPDVDYIMAIVEVIHKKEQTQPDYQPLDTAKAWEEFKSFYIEENGRTNSIYRSDEENEEKSEEKSPKSNSKATKRIPKYKKSKTLHRFLLVAASIGLLVGLTCVPVFGSHSIFQMLASWTAEQFGFYMPPDHSDPEQLPEEFAELQDIMQELGAELVVPRFPEGYEAKEPTLVYFPNNGTLQFIIMYQRESDYYLFGIYHGGNQDFYRYEKSISLVETKIHNGIEYYYLENSGNSTVAWYVNTIEYYIMTNRTTSDLKEIIESMYHE